MVLTRVTARKQTARRGPGVRVSTPYELRIRDGEYVPHFINRLRACMESYRLNDLPEGNDFHTPARQAEVLIRTLPIVGPLAQVRRRHSRILVNGEPNTLRYNYMGRWFLDLVHLEGEMIDAITAWDYDRMPDNQNSAPETSDSSDFD
ncbi:hypothetical protein SOVF_042160 [Spinacia oleracea]|nr:hypothetical protein SOVF_042160 [Spinacia oleracea]